MVVLNITDAQADFAQSVCDQLNKAGVRASVDLHNDKITYKVRKHSMQKVPFMLVVGDKEREAGAVAVRGRGNQDLGVMPISAFVEKVQSDVRAMV